MVNNNDLNLENPTVPLQFIADSLPVLISYIDRDARYVFVNQTYQEWLGKPRAEIVGQPLQNVLSPDAFEAVMPHIREALSGHKAHYQVKIPSHRGGFRYIEGNYTPHFATDGSVLGVISHVADITENKNLEENLRNARADAEKANQAKSNFLANVSHEIRTPMMAVLGFAELFREPNLSEAAKEEFIGRIEKSGQSLLRLIDDILDISKVEEGKLQIMEAEFAPEMVLKEVLDMLSGPIQKNNIEWKVEYVSKIPKKIISDSSRLRQILLNLIGNAVKFTRNGRVDVAINFAATSELSEITFVVSDTGVGIAPEDQGKLFAPFAQADDSITRLYGGSGLGLILSRRLAERLGGNLELTQSRPGWGSVFKLKIACSLPVGVEWISHWNDTTLIPRTNVDSNLQAGLASKNLDKVKILLAEDVTDNQTLIKRFLEGSGATVDIAENGEQAIQYALETSYDVILMDLQMPILDGIQATRRLRAQGYNRPIVALTAHAMLEERESSFAAGCDDHLTKPINRKDLIEHVRQLIASSRSSSL